MLAFRERTVTLNLEDGCDHARNRTNASGQTILNRDDTDMADKSVNRMVSDHVRWLQIIHPPVSVFEIRLHCSQCPDEACRNGDI